MANTMTWMAVAWILVLSHSRGVIHGTMVITTIETSTITHMTINSAFTFSIRHSSLPLMFICDLMQCSMASAPMR